MRNGFLSGRSVTGDLSAPPAEIAVEHQGSADLQCIELLVPVVLAPGAHFQVAAALFPSIDADRPPDTAAEENFRIGRTFVRSAAAASETTRRMPTGFHQALSHLFVRRIGRESRCRDGDAAGQQDNCRNYSGRAHWYPPLRSKGDTIAQPESCKDARVSCCHTVMPRWGAPACRRGNASPCRSRRRSHLVERKARPSSPCRPCTRRRCGLGRDSRHLLCRKP